MSVESRGRGRGRGKGRGEPVGTRGTGSIGQPSPNSPTDASTTITTNNMFSFPQNSQAQQYIAPSPITAIRFDDPTFSLEDDETFQQGLEIPAVTSPTQTNYSTLFQYSSQFPIARYPSPQSSGYNAYSTSQLPQYQPLQSTPFTFQTLLQSYQSDDIPDDQDITAFNPSAYSSAFANYGSSQGNNSYPKQQQPNNVQPIQPPSYTPFQRQQYQPGQPYRPMNPGPNTGYAPYQGSMGMPNNQGFVPIPAQMQQLQYQFQQMQLPSAYVQQNQGQVVPQGQQKYAQSYQYGQASPSHSKAPPPPSGAQSKVPVWGTTMKFSVPSGVEHDNNNTVASNNNHIIDDFKGNNNTPVSVPASTPVSGSSPTNNALVSNNNLSSKNNNNAASNNMVSSSLLALADSPANLAKKPIITTKRAGKPVPIATNHFEFRVKEQIIYQYAVEFIPDIESRRKRMKLLESQKELIGECYIFDGSMLFLQKQIGEFSFEVDMQFLNDSNSSSEDVPGAPTKQRVVITPTTQIKPGDNAPLQLYNMIFRKILRILKLKQIGRHYYDPHRPISIPQHRVELWPGYFTSVNPSEKGTVLIADVTHKVLRTDTVLDLLHEISANNGRNWREAAVKQLIGQVVLTRYNNRTYRIDEIAWDMTPLSTFVKKNGEKTSYQKYYSITYNKSLTETNQPLLVHKHKRRGHDDETIYLIPELCCMTGISDSMRADFQVMRDISEHTRVFPNRRGEELTRFLKHINEQEEVKQELDNWWLQLDPEMLITEGRVFNAEKVIFSKKAQVIDPKTGEWSGLCKNSELLTPVHIANWLLIYIGKNDKLAQDFCNNLIRVADSVGLKIEKPLMIQLNDDKKQTFIDAIKNNMRDKVQCVVCVLPSANKDRYDAIKKVCSVEISVPSQCVIAKSLSKPKTLLSVCNKIALQMNCKLGGELWKLEIPLSKTMLVGIDVCHDTSRGGRQSVAGFCASMNSSFTKYYSRVTFQKSGQELVDGLKVCMTEAVRQFFELNKYPPEIIIVFRDGVGDGMLEALVDHEIPQMKDTFKSFGDNYRPKLAVIVVKKRIHTRLFLRADSLMNPGPGTVVDSVCTHRSWYDFFLVSQSVRQGTVTPTHYHVVYDTTSIQPDHIQMLTYKMCHLYYNWPGTIRVPAPCQYAHKIAFLVGQSLHIDPSPKLTHKLHYL